MRGGIPAPSASRQGIGAHITQHPPTTGQWAGVYLKMLAPLALMVFVAYRWRVLRDGGWLRRARGRRSAQRDAQAGEPAGGVRRAVPRDRRDLRPAHDRAQGRVTSPPSEMAAHAA